MGTQFHGENQKKDKYTSFKKLWDLISIELCEETFIFSCIIKTFSGLMLN